VGEGGGEGDRFLRGHGEHIGHGTSRLACRRPLFRALAKAFLRAAEPAGSHQASASPPSDNAAR